MWTGWHNRGFSDVPPNWRTSHSSSADGPRWAQRRAGAEGRGRNRQDRVARRGRRVGGDLRVLRLVGIESEMELGYAGLHLLVRPFVEDLDALPPSAPGAPSCVRIRGRWQCRPAPRGAGDADVDVNSCHVPTVAVPRRRRAVARPRIDRCTRLRRPGVSTRTAWAHHRGARSRSRTSSYRGVTEVRIGGLAEAEAAELLERVAVGRARDDVGRRIATDTGGNPLAVRELGARVTASQLLGQAPLPHPLPVGRQIEEQYRGQVQSLPEDTRTFLLTAAADTTGDTALVLRGPDAGFRPWLGVACRRRRHDCCRAEHLVPASPDPLGGVQPRRSSRAPAGPPGARGGDRRRGRS